MAVPAEYGPWWMAAQTFIRWRRHGVWERLLNLVQEKGLRLGMAFLDGSNIRAHQKAAGAAKTYGPPRRQAVSEIWRRQSASTYPVSGSSPGQDGDPRVPGLIKGPASSAILAARLVEHRSTGRL